MLNEAHISMTGYVASQPRWRQTSSGYPNITMRVAWTPRWIDRTTGEWSDGHTSYVSVYCWRKLAENVATCVRKGDPVVVKGRLTVRDYTDKEGAPKISVEIDATSVGHDLCRGVAQFQRTRPATGKTAHEHAAELAAAPGDFDPGPQDQLAAGDGLATTAAEGPAGGEMFDEDAIAALAQEPVGASAPF